MNTNTRELRAIMAKCNLNARQVGEILGRKHNTVLVWCMLESKRPIPDKMLELLKKRTTRPTTTT